MSLIGPWRKQDVEAVERVQMRAVKFFLKDKNKSYTEKLRTLKLPTMKFRRNRGDMIEVYKIINGLYDKSTSVNLNFSQNKNTRGHEYKLYPVHVKYDLRKFFFTSRVVRIWNSLTDYVVHAPSVDSFKGRLDRLWCVKDQMYDWQCDII